MSVTNFVKQIRDITRNDAGINGDAQRIEQLTWMLFLKIYDDKEMEWECEDENFESIIPEGFHWREWADTSDPKGLKGDELLSFVDNELFPTLQNLDLPVNCPRRKSVVKEVFEDIHNYMKDGVLLRKILHVINEFDFTDPNEAHMFGTIYESILKELQSAGSSGEFYTPRALTDFMAKHVDLKLGDHIADFACGTGGFLNSARKELEEQVKTTEDRDTLNRSFFGIEKKPLPHLLCVTNLLLNRIEDPVVKHGNSLLGKVTDYSDKDKFDVILMNPPYGGSEKSEILANFPQKLRSAETADLFMILIMARLKKDGRAAVVVPDGFLFGTGNKAAIKEKLLKDFNLHTIVRLPTSVFAPYTSIATNILFFNGKGPTQETWFYRFDKPDGYKNFSKTRPMLLEHFADLQAWWNERKVIEEDNGFKAKSFTQAELKALEYNFDQCGYQTEVEEILPPEELIAKYKAKRAQYEAKIDSSLSAILKVIEGKNE